MIYSNNKNEYLQLCNELFLCNNENIINYFKIN